MAKGYGNRKDGQRKAAKISGQDRYFTGRPCLNGHISERHTNSGYCIECRREKDRDSYRKNPEKFELKAKRRYCLNKEKMKQKSREWYSKPENKEKAKITRAIYNSNNAEYVAEYARQNAKSYRERFPEKAKLAILDWWARNPERKKTYARNRRARKRGNGGSHTQAEVNEIFKAQNGKCAYCKIKLGRATNARHVDHIVPLIEGGTNDRRNLQILCQPCNLEKGRRDPLDHARKLGMLL